MQSRIAETAQIEEEKERRIKTLEEENRRLEVQIERSKEDLEIEQPKPTGYNQRKESIKGKSETVYTVTHTELTRLDGICFIHAFSMLDPCGIFTINCLIRAIHHPKIKGKRKKKRETTAMQFHQRITLGELSITMDYLGEMTIQLHFINLQRFSL